jgi:hypothetical protein
MYEEDPGDEVGSMVQFYKYFWATYGTAIHAFVNFESDEKLLKYISIVASPTHAYTAINAQVS